MLAPTVAPTMPLESRNHTQAEDVSMTDDYGEPSGSKRTLGGGVDFFSTIGIEVKKKPKPERRNPDDVRPPLYFLSL